MLSASALPSGDSRNGRILEKFGRDPAHPEQDRRTELRIAMEAKDQLDAIPDQFLHQKSFDLLAAAGAHVFAELVASARNVLRAHVHATPPISVLCKISRDRIFSTTLTADASCSLLRLRRESEQHFVDAADAEARKQLLAVGLVQPTAHRQVLGLPIYRRLRCCRRRDARHDVRSRQQQRRKRRAQLSGAAESRHALSIEVTDDRRRVRAHIDQQRLVACLRERFDHRARHQIGLADP